ncbi:MAG: amino acid adenylation domain-containing protein [Ferruginibacter sp.]
MIEAMMNKTIDLLYLAKQQGIEIVLNEEQLQLKLPKNKSIDKNLLQDIKDSKEAIIDFLRNNQRSVRPGNAITRAYRSALRHIPLSFGQERLWFIDRFEGSSQYHMSSVLRLKGKLNKDALTNAFNTIFERHEIVRSIYVEKDGQVYQEVKDAKDWQLNFVEGTAYKENKDKLQLYIESLISKPFNLSKDNMLRADLLTLDEEDHILIATMHHIASDGWSRSVLVKELVELYSAYEENRIAQLPEIPLQYADYAIWQHNYLSGELMEKKLGYWKAKLENVATLQLPVDYNRPAVQSTRGANVKFTIDKSLSAQLLELSRQQGSTLFMTLLAGFKVLLYHYSGQQDICVGSAIAGRQQQELEGMLGFFANTLVFRSEINEDTTFIEFLKQVKRTTIEAYENQEVPFDRIVDSVVKERSLSRSPLAQVMFALQNTPEVPELRLGNLQLSREGYEHTTAMFDITFFINESPNGLQGLIEYSTDLYNEDTLVRMAGHFKELLAGIIAAPHQKIGLLPLLTPSEKQQLLTAFNDTDLVVPTNKTVINLFEGIAAKTPGSVALVFEHERLTYKELNERSNQLAHYLIGKGVTHETLVPVCLKRSVDLIVSLLAILKSGGAYVPIDPGYPGERIRYMLEDTGARIVISNNSEITSFEGGEAIEIVAINKEFTQFSNQPTHNLNSVVIPGQLANVIYTSGSTGKPKGVMIEHKGLVNLVEWHNKAFNVSGSSNSTIMAGVGFDAFGWEIWPYLSIGASLLIIDDDTRLSPSKLLNLFNQYQITHSFVATALVQEFIQVSKNKTQSLQFLLTGGDKLSSINIEGVSYKLVNNYGPTENSVVSTSYQVQANNKESTPPIGAPIANSAIYILNKNDGLVPIGVAGELCISGAGLARGYLNRIQLTEEKFITNPFVTQEGVKMYQTGDIGRWLADGNIEYLGRKDEQVKIRGYRIELGEIENVLQQSGLVSQAIVLTTEINEGDKRLLGYFVPDWEVVKTKELELYRSQIAGWKELYENEYAQTEGEVDVDVEFNIIGWNDSFTKEAIPADQMAEWVKDIVEVILSKQPQHVLEIGSGTGLIYYQLAGKLKKYIGTDFSKSSISQIAQRVSKAARNYGDTELQVCAAHEITLKENEQIDTVILNSIVQYFPGEDYMSTVIQKGISILKGNGRIIIGDVRDNRLLKFFKGRLHLLKTQQSASVKEFNWAVEQETLNEEELCFSPEYFYNLASVYPQITHIDIQWKQSDFINELTLYRYTVIIYVGIQNETIDPAWQNWDIPANRQNITAQLNDGLGIIALKDVPNPRLWKERQLGRALQDKTVGTVADLLIALEKEELETAGVKELLQLAKTKGYFYRFLLDEDPLKINILLELQPTNNFIRKVYSDTTTASTTFNTNIPLFADIMLLIQKDIILRMEQQLPEYMIPSELHALGKLPLTNNGKIDKSFLSQLAGRVAINQLSYNAPRTPMETTLAAIWQSLLSIDKIGIDDNFFDLGGHSLMVMRLISAVRRQLGIELAIKDLFLYPSIVQLADHLQLQDKGLLLPPIEARSRPAYIPLSFGQERLWFIDRLEGSVPFHAPMVLKLAGNLNTEALAAALQSIVNRHEVLRTVFREENGRPFQYVNDKDNWVLNHIDGATYQQNDHEFKSVIKALINKPFDLLKDHMLRADLIKIDEQQYILILTLHHIASDAWSLSILVKEVVELYKAYTDERPAQLPYLAIQYADFAVWQKAYLQGEMLAYKLNYWKEKLDGIIPLQLPSDFTRPAVQSTKGASIGFNIDKQLAEQLKELSQQQGTTLFMTMLAAFNVLLHGYTGQKDICVGTSIAGRQQQEVENLIGFFVNILALRTTVDPSITFTALLERVKQTTLDAYEHQEVPFEKVVDAVVKERDLSRSPLFQVLLVVLNTPVAAKTDLGDLILSGKGYEHTSSKYDITFFVTETVQGLAGSMEYSTELFSEQTIQSMITHLNELLHAIVNNPLQKVGDLPLITMGEKEELLQKFNATTLAYPGHQTIIELFEAQVQLNPTALAVIFQDDEITYDELNVRASKLANYLLGKGVKPATNVALLCNRGIETIVGIMGILKAGCAYVPINIEYPVERINFIIEDADITSIVHNNHELLEATGLDKFNCIYINDSSDAALASSPAINTTAGSCAYIMFTSGTTGRPKGIAVSHQNIIKLAFDGGPIAITSTDRVLQWSNYSFDGSTYDIYSSLLNGATICMINDSWASDIDELSKVMIAKNITVCFITTALFNTFIDVRPKTLIGLRKILFGGEMVSLSHVKKALSILGEGKIVHVYGPTETTVYACSYAIDKLAAATGIPIGKPLSNTRFYVLNEYKKLLPVGVPGELYIGGDGVSLGYVNNPLLTAERFIQNPYSDISEDRLYRTGDIVRWLPGGVIEYISRIDDQVKIRGYRIELGEIESVLQECSLVRHAAVIAKTDKDGTKRLVAYIVPNDEFDKAAIQSFLKNKLPDYMVPALMVEMESLPLNANGKIDRKVLPDPEPVQQSNDEFVAPANHIEKVLANVWQKLLGLDSVGIHDNFFEIGGDSLLAIRVVSALRKELDLEMPISNIFEFQTIALLAAQLETQSGITVLPPIQLAPRPAFIPLSFSQERLWFIDRLEGSRQYHIPAVMRLKGELDKSALEYALQEIVNRHEVLRTIFLEEDGNAHQVVKDKAAWELPVTSGLHFNNDKPALQKLIQQMVSTPFDLSKDNMLRSGIITINDQEHILVVTLHHIASDGWSRSILVKEVAALYTAHEEKRAASLAPLPVQYADFAIWQRNYLQGEVLDKKLDYWKQKLQGIEPLQLPIDFPRPNVQTTRGGNVGFSFDKELSEALRLLSQQQGTTLFMTLTTALKVLLHRYSGQKDICIGTGVAGRQQQEVEGLIGFFINTLVLRSEINTEENFIDLLQQVRATTLEAYENQEVPFEKVVDVIIKKRDRSRNPVFQVMFVLQNTPEVPSLELGKLQLVGEGHEHTTAQFDLSFSITEYAHGLIGSLEYNADLYKKATIERLLTHFKQLVVAIVNEPQKKISELSIISNEETQQLLVGFNSNETNYPKDKTIVGLFEDQVIATPGSVALIFEDNQFTYRELNDRANYLANYLQSKGVVEGTLVAISSERSLNMMVGILGILKAGGAYVPIDAAYPTDRIQFMLDDTDVRIVLASEAVRTKIPVSDKFEIINLYADWDNADGFPVGNVKTNVKPESLAYVIYTSGSTGKPKGVMVTQRNVVSLVKGINYVSLTKEDVLLSTGSSSFDATTIEYWGMLLNGGQLVLCTEDTLMDSVLLKAAIDNRKVTRMWFTSSWFNQLVESDITLFEGLGTVMVGGEKLSEHHIEKFRQAYPQIEIINGYGPTENTTFSLTYKVKETKIKSAIPIGRPLNNRKAYILDKKLQLVPVGVVGEICLSGAGLSRGYLNRPELTAEKFVLNPFDKNGIEIMYKTGDIGRWLPDGNIEYLGRIDEQVKIRGYRIELGEIETVLLESEMISQAVVIVSQDQEGNKRLVAYVLPTGLYNKNQFITNLKTKLPDYMIPSLWVELEQLPLTKNGKVDKRALADPLETDNLSNQYVAPATEMEIKLATIWEEILQVERIGINDNFFELGGHSLLAMRLMSAVRKDLQIELAVKELFNYPTITEMASYLQEQKKGSLLPAIKPLPRPDYIPLSFSQERLWFVDQLEGSVKYHAPAVLRLKGKLNQDALTFALKNILERHEVLRTVFHESEGKPYQTVIEHKLWAMSQVDGAKYQHDKAGLQSLVEKLISVSFDLSKDYMLRADLITIEVDDYVLVVNIHHIASDGWSLPIIVQEVMESYTAFEESRQPELPQLRLQYADYAIWQRKYLDGEILNIKAAYWKNKLTGVSPLQLPTDFTRPSVRTGRGTSTHIKIEKELADQLNELSQQQGVTLYMTLLATFNVLLNRYSGDQDICVGASIANRPQQELERLIGFFVNTLALRNQVDDSEPFTDLLQQVKTTMLEAYLNQDVPFERVVEEVVKDRDTSRTPLFQVMLVLLNTPESNKLGIGDVNLSPETFEVKISKFDITFHILLTANGLPVTIEYNTDIFREDTILRMAGHFKELLKSVVKKPHQSIDLLQMLTDAEEQQLLAEFN